MGLLRPNSPSPIPPPPDRPRLAAAPRGQPPPAPTAAPTTTHPGRDRLATIRPAEPAAAAPTLKVSVSPSIAGSIFGALDFLTAYPYGCTEQTMSSFLPNIVVSKAMKDLHLSATVNTPELEKKIQAGMERLKDYQHEDGGWSWWKEDESLA